MNQDFSYGESSNSMRRQTLLLGLLLQTVALCRPACALDDADMDAFQQFLKRPNSQIIGKFTFTRIKYDSVGGYNEAYYDYDGRRWMRWETDYPESDENFLFRLQELTVCDPNPQLVVHRLTDPELFQSPFIYMSDPGWAELSKQEIKCLGDYLRRGGFLWVDDFWGIAEWDNLERLTTLAVPEYHWKLIPNDHPIMTIVFKMKECPQIPAIDFWRGGWKWDPPGIHKEPVGGEAGVSTVHFRGLFTDKGELAGVATHNTDFGDGFERETEDKGFFEACSVYAYALGINIIVYAMTH